MTENEFNLDLKSVSPKAMNVLTRVISNSLVMPETVDWSTGLFKMREQGRHGRKVTQLFTPQMIPFSQLEYGIRRTRGEPSLRIHSPDRKVVRTIAPEEVRAINPLYTRSVKVGSSGWLYLDSKLRLDGVQFSDVEYENLLLKAESGIDPRVYSNFLSIKVSSDHFGEELVVMMMDPLMKRAPIGDAIVYDRNGILILRSVSRLLNKKRWVEEEADFDEDYLLD